MPVLLGKVLLVTVAFEDGVHGEKIPNNNQAFKSAFKSLGTTREKERKEGERERESLVPLLWC